MVVGGGHGEDGADAENSQAAAVGGLVLHGIPEGADPYDRPPGRS